MKIEKSVEDDVDLVLCIAMFRCFNEQLYTLKGRDSKLAKQKFSRLVRLAKIYDDEIIKSGNNNDEIDIIYDKIMDIIDEVKEQIIEELKVINDE